MSSFVEIKQKENNECLLACLKALIKYYHNQKIDIEQLKKNIILSEKGLNLLQFKNLSKDYEIEIKIHKIRSEDLNKLHFSDPIIIIVNNENYGYHSLLIYKETNKNFLIIDPEKGKLEWIKKDEIKKKFSNLILGTKKLSKFLIKKEKIVNDKNKLKSIFLSFPYFFSKIIVILFTHLTVFFIMILCQFLYKILIDITISKEELNLSIIIIVFFLMNLSRINLNYWLSILNKLFKNKIKFTFLEIFNEKLINLKLKSYQELKTENFFQYHSDIENIIETVTFDLINLFFSLITAIISIFILIIINIKVLIWISLFSVFMISFSLLTNYSYERIKEKYIKKNIKFNNFLLETINSFLDIKTRNLTKIVNKNLKNSCHSLYKEKEKNEKIQIKFNLFFEFFNFLFNFIFLIFCLNSVINSKMTLGNLIFISVINSYIFYFLQNLSNFLINKNVIIASIKRLNYYLNLEEEEYENKNSYLTFEKKIKSIDLINLSFDFQNKKIFSKLNICIKPHTFIYGSSGCGKTTLLLILSKQYEIKISNSIKINNSIELEKIKKSWWSKETIYLQSNPYIFQGTVAENIFSFNCDSYNLEKFYQDKFDKILNNLNLQLSTYCYKNGFNLSKGQRQTISILSLFFNNEWKLIILDEALNNINNEIKNKLINKLLEKFKNNFLIYVSHDQNLKKYFQNIINLEAEKNGK
jgi:ABC-type bacteriocin/lantibiotic exporter with double-glycine peptidase domain